MKKHNACLLSSFLFNTWIFEMCYQVEVHPETARLLYEHSHSDCSHFHTNFFTAKKIRRFWSSHQQTKPHPDLHSVEESQHKHASFKRGHNLVSFLSNLGYSTFSFTIWLLSSHPPSFVTQIQILAQNWAAYCFTVRIWNCPKPILL